MARPSSKIMTSADKKVAIAGLKTALKQQNEISKGLDTEFKAAQKAFDAVQKSVDAELKAAQKVFDAAVKAAAKTVAAAEKKLDAAAKKYGKYSAAAVVGSTKLTDKMQALEAASVAEVVPSAKPAKTKRGAAKDEAATM